MKDFRRPRNEQPIEEQERALKKKLRALQILGSLIAVFGAVAAAAYFSDLVLLPFLADRQTALTCLVLSGAGILVEGVASGFIHVRLGKLERSRDS